VFGFLRGAKCFNACCEVEEGAGAGNIGWGVDEWTCDVDKWTCGVDKWACGVDKWTCGVDEWTCGMDDRSSSSCLIN